MRCIHWDHFDDWIKIGSGNDYLPKPEPMLAKISKSIWYNLDPVSISNKTSYHKILWSIEAPRLVVCIVASLWNLTSTSATLLPRCLSNFRAIVHFLLQISWLRDIARSYNKTSYWILKQGPSHNELGRFFLCFTSNHILLLDVLTAILAFKTITQWYFAWKKKIQVHQLRNYFDKHHYHLPLP